MLLLSSSLFAVAIVVGIEISVGCCQVVCAAAPWSLGVILNMRCSRKSTPHKHQLL